MRLYEISETFSLLLEYSHNKTIDQYREVLENRYEYQETNKFLGPNADINKIVKWFESNDPTPQKKYVLIMIQLYLGNPKKGRNPWFEHLEDVGKMPEYIRWMTANNGRNQAILKRNGLSTDLMNKSLYPDFNTFADHLDVFMKEEKELGNDALEIRDWEKQGKIEVLMLNPRWYIIITLTKDANVHFGKGTRWCTTTFAFSGYANMGPLYQIKNLTTGERWQLHFHNNEFKDVKDREVNAADWFRKYSEPSAVLLKEFHNLPDDIKAKSWRFNPNPSLNFLKGVVDNIKNLNSNTVREIIGNKFDEELLIKIVRRGQNLIVDIVNSLGPEILTDKLISQALASPSVVRFDIIEYLSQFNLEMSNDNERIIKIANDINVLKNFDPNSITDAEKIAAVNRPEGLKLIFDLGLSVNIDIVRAALERNNKSKERFETVLNSLLENDIDITQEPYETMVVNMIDGNADLLTIIQHPSDRMMMTAVSRVPIIIKDIPNPSEKVQLAAVEKNVKTYSLIENPTYTVSELALKKDANEVLRYVPEKHLDKKMVKRLVSQDGLLLLQLKHKMITPELIKLATISNGLVVDSLRSEGVDIFSIVTDEKDQIELFKYALMEFFEEMTMDVIREVYQSIGREVPEELEEFYNSNSYATDFNPILDKAKQRIMSSL